MISLWSLSEPCPVHHQLFFRHIHFGVCTSKCANASLHTLTVLKKANGKWLLARDANLLAPVQRTDT